MSGLSLPLSGPLCSYIQSLQQPTWGRNIIGPIPTSLTDIGWFNVADYQFGAKIDTATNDSAAVSAAISAAVAVGGGVVFIPHGKTGQMLIGSAISVPQTVSLYAPGIVIKPYGGYTGNAVALQAAQYGAYGEFIQIGAISGFSAGAGLYFPDGSSYMNASVTNITNCLYGIEFNATATLGIFGHQVQFGLINTNVSSSVGILFNQSGGATATIQGNDVRGNSILTCSSGITFQSTGVGVGGGGMSANYCDVGTINGNVASTTGITYASCSPTSMNFVRVRDSFGAFQTNEFITMTSAQPARQAFELAVAAGGTTLTGAGGYSTFNLYPGGGAGLNVLRVLGGNTFSGSTVGSIGGVFTANTTANTRSSFNSGNAVFYQRFVASCVVTGLTAGNVTAFYVYSPYTTGNINGVVGTVLQMPGGLANLILLECYDNSTVNANEIRITFGNPTGASISTTVYVGIQVGGF